MDERRLAAHEMYARYAHRADSGDLTGWSRLFADDGVLVAHGQEFTGPAGAYAFANRSGRDGTPMLGRHIITNIEGEVAGDSAAMSADFLHVSTSTAGAIIDMVGSYKSELTWRGDEWLFARHELIFLVAKRDPMVPIG